MEQWEVDFKWLEVRHQVKDQFGKKVMPDLNAMLFLIGVQEVGQVRTFSKEEKQDLMHVAVCRLLEKDGIYEYVGKDDEGWPHFELNRQFPNMARQEQEELLKIKIIEYFNTPQG
jgi:hypothetical protein